MEIHCIIPKAFVCRQFSCYVHLLPLIPYSHMAAFTASYAFDQDRQSANRRQFLWNWTFSVAKCNWTQSSPVHHPQREALDSRPPPSLPFSASSWKESTRRRRISATGRSKSIRRLATNPFLSSVSLPSLRSLPIWFPHLIS